MVKILCEGVGDQKFLSRLLDYLGIAYCKDNFQIMRSKTFFFQQNHANYKALSQAIDNQEVTALLFILDADNNDSDEKRGGYENSLTAIEELIEEKSWQTISRVFIACDPVTQIGCLESLIYATLPEEQQHCIDNFIACSGVQFGHGCKHKPILFNIFRSVWGKPEKIETFEHEHFSELKETLRAVFDC